MFKNIILSNQKQLSCKKRYGPQKGHGEKRCLIQDGGQEMAVMVKVLITTIQVNLVPLGLGTKFT